jgi:hypothetical protein
MFLFLQITPHPATPYPKGLSGKGNLSKLSPAKTSNSTKSAATNVTSSFAAILVTASVAFLSKFF